MVCVKKKIIAAAAIMRCKECKRRYKKGKKQVHGNTPVVNDDSGGSGGLRKLKGSGNKPEKQRTGGGGKKVSFKTKSTQMKMEVVLSSTTK